MYIEKQHIEMGRGWKHTWPQPSIHIGDVGARQHPDTPGAVGGERIAIGTQELHGVVPGRQVLERVAAVGAGGGRADPHIAPPQLHRDALHASLACALEAIAVGIQPNAVPDAAR